MTEFSAKTLNLLRRAGWHEKYECKDLHRYLRALEEAGYTVYPVVEAFLRRYGGLYIPDTNYQPFHFDAIFAASGISINNVKLLYNPRVNTQLCVIGEAYVVLMMGPNGKVYLGYDDFMALVGNSGEDAIEAICTGRDMTEIPE